mmetsp:Transcript_4361/g.6709  ORF Transcript_4361/g.6709 Transcript_4361/m.6709 type:complete len:123 (-) Transcript_4361:3359-3727(-)
MLQSVSLHYFKNFGDRANSSVQVGSEGLTVIAGRNGSGKSALLEAVQWCLFARRAHDLRARSGAQMVNVDSPDGAMAVTVVLRDALSGATMNLTKKYDGQKFTMHMETRGAPAEWGPSTSVL